LQKELESEQLLLSEVKDKLYKSQQELVASEHSEHTEKKR